MDNLANELPVLVVDDTENCSQSTVAALSSIGIASEVAHNGHLALDMLEKNAYAAVIIDYSMPNMTGVDCAREIRRREKITLTRIPIIGYSCKPIQNVRSVCKDAGMDYILDKDMPVERLVEVLVYLQNSNSHK